MGCGKARFGRKGQNTTTILVSKFVPWDLEATRTWDLEATRDGTTRQPTWTSRQAAMIRAGSLEVCAGWLKVPSRIVPRSLVLVMKKLPFSWNLTQLLTINNSMTMCMCAMKDLTWQMKRVTKSETCLKAIWTSSPHFARSRALKPLMRFNPSRRWSTTTHSSVSSLTQQWSWLRQFSGRRWC